MSHANASDVASRLGRQLTDEESTLAATRLADAERMIKRRIPDLDTKIGAGDIDVEDVKQVEADAVLRLVRNPDGYASETDGTYGYTFNHAMASGRLEILPHEWEILGTRASSMFVITPNPSASGRIPFDCGG